MAIPLRNKTNLVVPPNLMLDKKLAKARFMYVYSGAYPGLEPVFMQKLWLSVVFPEIANSPSFGKDRKGVREYAKFFEGKQKAGLLKLKKVNDPQDPHFVVAVPLAEFDAWSLPTFADDLRNWFTDGKGDDHYESTERIKNNLSDAEATGQLHTTQILVSELLPKVQGLDARAQLELKACMFGLRIQSYGSLTVVYADFKITKEEAQQLTTTEWLMIRNIDLYPLLLSWQISLWGYRGNAPHASFPMSKISKTLPPVHESQARVNEYGLSVTPDGRIVWLPEKLDNTTRYEDLYSQVGDKGDDTFGLVDLVSASRALISGQELKVGLPANIPVLIDWVNNRFAFTQSNGVLKILDLTRFNAVNAAHARNILGAVSVDPKEFVMYAHMAVTAGLHDRLFFTEEEAQIINADDPVTASRLIGEGGITVEEYLPIALTYYENFILGKSKSKSTVAMPLSEVSIEGPEIWRPLARFIDSAQAAVLANMDAVNHKYSVSGTVSRLGMMILISNYGNNFSDTVARANTICSAAQNQGVDKNWTPPSVPLIMDNPERPFSLLPHQAKVRNIMKGDPDFAILPVQAGGGKTPLAIVDVLMEIKANRSQPYLIMCPPALVPQYVKEVTYFTAGKLNVIPIATDTILRNGFQRLTEMIRTAPRNTVVIVNYDVLRNRAYDVCYGTTNVKVYPIIEFLRQFNFGYALMDEAHYLKNDSQRTRAAQILIADIPKKRLASGTMAHDSPSDLAIQIALLDPTLFGSREDFNRTFGEEVAGGRVMKWRPQAQQLIMERIKSRVVVAKAMRKEWAALLPHAVERMHKVDMSDAQRTVYETILTEALDRMKEDAKSNPALKKFFEGEVAASPMPMLKNGDQGQNEEEDEEAEQDADESAGEDLANLLGFYLARIEQFLTAPGKDELGARILQGDDLRSPKVNKILEIVKEHIDKNLPGKVLIFTNFVESAEEIFEAAGPDLRRSGILYTAGNKVEDGAAFETNDSKRWMVGVENSMNTGLNFQFVSRLIRVENVWNPGTLEQGNSRINRPEMKKADERPSIYYDWIITNNSVDVTKVARLISKIIAVSKFENTESPAYESIPDVPVIKMSAASIQRNNSWETDLKDYMIAYQEHNQVRFDDYEDYKAKHGGLTLFPLQEAPRPPDAALMASVPYVAGLELYKGSEHGLLRADEYMRMSADEMADDSGGDEDEEVAEGQLTKAQQRKYDMAQSVKGKRVHTEFGDGVIKGVGFKRKQLNVALDNGYLVKVRFSGAFIITDKANEEQDLRTQILNGIAEDMPVQEGVTMEGARVKVDAVGMRRAEQERMRKQREQDRQNKVRPGKAPKPGKPVKEVAPSISVELQFNVSNGFLSVVHFVQEGSDAGNALQALGFRPVEPYVYAPVNNANQFLKQFQAWKDAGFSFEKNFAKTGASDALRNLMEMLRAGQVAKGAMNYRFSSQNQLQNFFRMELKPTASSTEFKPYPMIEDGQAYIVMHTRGQPATMKAIQVKSPGIRWHKSDPCLAYYGLDLAHTAAKLREIQNAGIQISNIDELRVQARKIRKQKFRNSEE